MREVGRERGRGRERGGGGVDEELGGVVLEEPVAEAALFPFGKVLFGDGTVIEVGSKDGFDFGERVEPWENGFVGLVIVKTEVELLAELMGETCDFADTSCSVHMIYNFSFCEKCREEGGTSTVPP